MSKIVNKARSGVRALVKRNPQLKRAFRSLDDQAGMVQHTMAQVLPQIIRPSPRKLTVAVTAYCNLRCKGCRYGRDFMLGQQLSLSIVKTLLDDAKAAGVETVRLYGGEPLLHPDLAAMIRHAIDIGLSTYITTNGLLLRQKIKSLYEAGLRNLTIGFYGTDHDYDTYVQRENRYHRMEQSIAGVRDRYGSSVSIQLNYLLMRPSCNLEWLENAWSLARRYNLEFTADLIHYSLPYFTEGPHHELQFSEADRPAIMCWVEALARLKIAHPRQIKESLISIYSIPDWLLKGPSMRVPCDARKLIWVGADGTVQLCYAAFKLGNLHEQRLHTMLFGAKHRQAARDAFSLNCPRCHCEREARILKHLPSRHHYRSAVAG